VRIAPRRIGIRLGVALLPLALAGCGASLGFTAASYGVDGAAYATEGKSTTDMALSAIESKNCALLRVIDGKPICKPWTPAELAQMQKNKEDVARHHPDVILMSENEDFEAVGVPAPKKPPLADVNAPEVAAAAPAPSEAPPALPVAAVKREALAPPAATRIAVAPEKDDKTATTASSTQVRVAHARPGDVYLVLASFSTRANAERARMLYAKSGQGMSLAVLDGPTYHRVASGPYGRAELAAARARIERELGVAKSWAVAACPGAGGAACTEMARRDAPSPQLAARVE